MLHAVEGLKNDAEIGDFGTRVLWDIYTSAKRSTPFLRPGGMNGDYRVPFRIVFLIAVGSIFYWKENILENLRKKPILLGWALAIYLFF